MACFRRRLEKSGECEVPDLDLLLQVNARPWPTSHKRCKLAVVALTQYSSPNQKEDGMPLIKRASLFASLHVYFHKLPCAADFPLLLMERHERSIGFSSQRQRKSVPNVQQRYIYSLKMRLAALPFHENFWRRIIKALWRVQHSITCFFCRSYSPFNCLFFSTLCLPILPKWRPVQHTLRIVSMRFAHWSYTAHSIIAGQWQGIAIPSPELLQHI